MGNTRKGDTGLTDSICQKNIRKDDARIKAIGYLDRLSAELGAARLENKEAAPKLKIIQEVLIEIMGIVSGTGKKLDSGPTAMLEAEIARINAALPPLKEFVLPGENKAEVCLHLARTSCRQAECMLVAAGAPAEALAFINRLSLYLFALARAACKKGS